MDAAAVVAVERLDDAGKPIRFAAGPPPSAERTTSDFGTGRPAGVEEAVGEVLVGRDVDADRRGPRGHRGADALLVDALAELDERGPIEAQERDVARGRLVEDRLGRGPEGLALGEEDEASSSAT